MAKNLFYTDGGTANNGQFGKQMSVICATDGFGDVEFFEIVGDRTNNESELLAIFRLLQNHPEKTYIISDSNLAVNLVNRKWKTKTPRLQKILDQIWALDRKFKLIWKPREINLAGFVIEERLGL